MGKKVLDAGCGSGRHSLFLLREGFEVHGIDTSATGLEIANAYAAQTCSSFYPQVASVTSIPYTDDYFNAILCWGIIHYLTPAEEKQAFAEMFRVLKPGGLLALTLRSSADSEAGNPRNEEGMSLSNANESKGILFKYYDETELLSTLSLFNDVSYGHKTRTLLGDTTRVFAHWFITARK